MSVIPRMKQLLEDTDRTADQVDDLLDALDANYKYLRATLSKLVMVRADKDPLVVKSVARKVDAGIKKLRMFADEAQGTADAMVQAAAKPD